MRERDYRPTYGSVTRHIPNSELQPSNPLRSSDEWAKRLDKVDQAQAADVRHAIEEAVVIQSDVHLYRKRGSMFLGIGFEPGTGPMVKIYEH